MTRFAGFDIGGTNARVRLYDADWTPIAERRQGTRGAQPDAIADTIREMLLAACEDAQISPKSLSSLEVGVIRQHDPTGQIVLNAPNLGARNVEFGQLLRARLYPDCGQYQTRIVNSLSPI